MECLCGSDVVEFTGSLCDCGGIIVPIDTGVTLGLLDCT